MFARMFSEIKEELKRDDAVLPRLLNNLYSVTEKPFPGPHGIIGISKVGTWCARAHVMGYRMGINGVDEIDATAAWRMDRGTAMHSAFQEMWLGPLGILRGGWRCPKCAHVTGGVPGERGVTVNFDSAVLMPEKCEGCSQKNGKWSRFSYVEPEVRFDAPFFLWGKLDGLIRLMPKPEEVLDIKTSENLDRPFTRTHPDGSVAHSPSLREAPKLDHVKQLHWYMDAGGYKNGRIIYINPGATNPGDGIAEHTVVFNPKMMHEQKEMVRGLRQALEEKDRPVPACPYDGVGSYGQCNCVQMEVLWESWRNRPLPEEHGDRGAE
jgi:hypothetical protein